MKAAREIVQLRVFKLNPRTVEGLGAAGIQRDRARPRSIVLVGEAIGTDGANRSICQAVLRGGKGVKLDCHRGADVYEPIITPRNVDFHLEHSIRWHQGDQLLAWLQYGAL